MWVRGLKHGKVGRRIAEHGVAPYVGAWIETYQPLAIVKYITVAPYVGAWIETTVLLSPTSVPLVAPYVGAWIETRLEGAGNYEYKSHPMWVRGLKQGLSAYGTSLPGRTLCGCVD